SPSKRRKCLFRKWRQRLWAAPTTTLGKPDCARTCKLAMQKASLIGPAVPGRRATSTAHPTTPGGAWPIVRLGTFKVFSCAFADDSGFLGENRRRSGRQALPELRPT